MAFAKAMAGWLSRLWRDLNAPGTHNSPASKKQRPQSRGDSFVVHLYGRWGAGKTTFIGQLDKVLKESTVNALVSSWIDPPISRDEVTEKVSSEEFNFLSLPTDTVFDLPLNVADKLNELITGRGIPIPTPAGLLRRANDLARGGLIAAANEKCQQVSAEHVRLAATELV